ncbi:MAG: beta-galactosidase, partial [Clostridia bacterium]|nr:beta-galactosidase [Clostridia bacterium]
YNPEQWMEQKETIWKQDMQYAREAGINTLSIGIFSWAFLEPEDGVYDFSWMDEVMDNLAANGIKAVLATPSGARPAWLAKKYPSVLRMTENRLPNVFGGRHNACYSSPDYERKVTEINTRLAERYKDHPALMMWHVSNEYNNDCHCPRCQERFRDWCKARYGTIDNLNRAWWNSFWSHKYTSFDEIISPSSLGEEENVAHLLAWRRFSSDNLVRFFKTEIEPLRRITPNVPVTANLMGTFTGLDYYALGRAMDISSWDNYPAWVGDERDLEVARISSFKHDLMRGVCDQKPFLMMESSPSSVNWHTINPLRKPGTVLYQGLQAIAHGSDSVQYFQFRAGRGGSEQYHGAVVDRTGTTRTRTFREVAEVGATLKQLKAVAGSETRNQIALLYDWHVRWAVDGAWMLHRHHQKYEETVRDFHIELGRLGYGVDMVDEMSDLSGYKVLIAPMAYIMRPGFGDKLKAFVAGGGTLITTYVTGYVNDELLTYMDADPSPVNEITGMHVDECDALDDRTFGHFHWNGKKYSIKEMAELATPTTAQTLAVYADRFYATQPCFTVNEYGKGRCYYIAVRTDADFLNDALRYMLGEANLKPILPALPEGTWATERYQEDGKRFVFVQNGTHEKKTVTLPKAMKDAVSGKMVYEQVELGELSVTVLTDE